MNDAQIINSKNCTVPDMNDSDAIITVDLSIMEDNGYCGLLHHTDDVLEDSTVIMPCEYDNLFFIEADEFTYLIASSEGTQGLFKLQAFDNNFGKDVVVTRLLRCIYDRIEVCKTISCFLLYRKNEVVCYDLTTEKIITSGYRCEELNSQHLLCQTSAGSELWDLANHRLISTLPANVRCQYIGIYEHGDVFLVEHRKEANRPISQQLMFCEFFGGAVRLSPENDKIVIHTRMSSNICHVVGVEMLWGDKKEALSDGTISAFAPVWENNGDNP